MQVCTSKRLGWVAAVLWSVAGTAAGDLIYLQNGIVDGEIIEESEQTVKVQGKLGTLTISRDHIRSIEKGKSLGDVYRQKWIEVNHKDLKARTDLANWARKHGLDAEADQEFQQILKVDPENEAAHRALGYAKVGDRWVPAEEAKIARGLVRFRGRWMRPSERERLKALEERSGTRQEVEELFHKMRRAKPFERDSYIQQLYEVKTRFAAHYIAKFIADKNAELREAATMALGRLKDRSVTPQLVEVALDDPDAEVRRLAGKAMKLVGDVSAIKRIAPYLANKEKHVRVRAARALGEINDVRAVPDLIEGLYVKVRSISRLDPFNRGVGAGTTVSASGGSTITRVKSPAASKMGGSSLLLRKEPTDSTNFEENQAALDSLKKITGQDFDFSKNKWRTWWENSREDLLGKG